jgi:hypothetical protein
MDLSGFRQKPSLCPRIREIPAGVGYRNYSIINGRGHGESCSQLEVEVMIIIASVEFT